MSRLLQAELKRRENAIKTLPVPLENPDWEKLKQSAIAYNEKILENEYETDDAQQYLYKELIETIYCKEYWAWRKTLKF